MSYLGEGTVDWKNDWMKLTFWGWGMAVGTLAYVSACFCDSSFAEIEDPSDSYRS